MIPKIKQVLLASFAAVVLFVSLIGCHRAFATVTPSLLKPTGHITLFTTWYGYRSDEYLKISFAAISPEAEQIRTWMAAHRTNWSFCSSEVHASNTQIDSNVFVIEFAKGRLHLVYPPIKETDPDTWVNVERPLSHEEENFWLSIVKKIKQASQPSQPMPQKRHGSA